MFDIRNTERLIRFIETKIYGFERNLILCQRICSAFREIWYSESSVFRSWTVCFYGEITKSIPNYHQIPSLSVLLLKPNSYSCDGIFSLYLTNIEDTHTQYPTLGGKYLLRVQRGRQLQHDNFRNESPHDKTNKMTAPSEDYDQPSLIRVFAVRMKKAWVLSYPLSAQRRHWSDWVNTLADLSLCWAHSHFIGFVMRWLIFKSLLICLSWFLMVLPVIT